MKEWTHVFMAAADEGSESKSICCTEAECNEYKRAARIDGHIFVRRWEFDSELYERIPCRAWAVCRIEERGRAV